MKIGFLTIYDPKKIEFAGRNGFGSIQLMISPRNPLDPIPSEALGLEYDPSQRTF